MKACIIIATLFFISFAGNAQTQLPAKTTNSSYSILRSDTGVAIIGNDTSKIIRSVTTADTLYLLYETPEFLNLKSSVEGEGHTQHDVLKNTTKADQFSTQCCSNHTPQHCAETSAEKRKLSDNGCTGFYSPE